MTNQDDIAAGMQLAYGALLSFADDNHPAALAAINTATEAEAKYALGYLLGITAEQAALIARGRKPSTTAGDQLRALAEAVQGDIVAALAADIINDAERDL